MSCCEILEWQKANLCIRRPGGTISVINSLAEKREREKGLPLPCPAAAGRSRNICLSERGAGQSFSGEDTQRKPIFSTKRGMT
jgi:hypothetical protein